MFTTALKCLVGSLRRLFGRRGAFGGDGAFAAKPKDVPMPKRSSKRPTPAKAAKSATSRKTARKAKAESSTEKLPNAAKIAPSEQSKTPGRSESKQSKVVASLRSPSGATIDAMMKATGWQQHSIRGFLAGVVRKKLKLNLVSDARNNGRVYRITGDAPPSQASVQPDQA